jgi:hypothetical protein
MEITRKNKYYIKMKSPTPMEIGWSINWQIILLRSTAAFDFFDWDI